MDRTRPWKTLIPLLVVAALISAAAIAFAGPPAQEPPSSEPGAPPPRLAVPPGDERAPDQDGYTGAHDGAPHASSASEDASSESAPLPAQPNEESDPGERTPGDGMDRSSSEGEPLQPPPDWESMFAEPQADEDAYYDARDAALQDWSLFRYVHVTGAALRPRDSAVPWRYGGYGCVYVDSTADLLNIDLQLPTGSRVEYLRLYYYDASSTNGTAWLTRYDNAGGFYDLIMVTSSGEGTYGTTLSAYYGQTVDTYNYSYALSWNAHVTGSAMRLCGLRVAYRVPQ
ncbi:MAG: hypothetical protein JXA09_04610 [Anaerolineae bacterium]|nr:hypothetical protein [Anaerolineae bacterium]